MLTTWIAIVVTAGLAAYMWADVFKMLRDLRRVCGSAERLDLEVELRVVAALEPKR